MNSFLQDLEKELVKWLAFPNPRVAYKALRSFLFELNDDQAALQFNLQSRFFIIRGMPWKSRSQAANEMK
jgi:hypothetical protein